jgi:hypothetical protein
MDIREYLENMQMPAHRGWVTFRGIRGRNKVGDEGYAKGKWYMG